MPKNLIKGTDVLPLTTVVEEIVLDKESLFEVKFESLQKDGFGKPVFGVGISNRNQATAEKDLENTLKSFPDLYDPVTKTLYGDSI